jgi:TetR/AcrR family transcriptional regulator of autoinduction and epiphytic fitness
MTTKKRDTSKKRTAILNAAVQAFVNEGYDNSSMDRIAEMAGASKRTVYNHFPGKEALFREVLNRFMAEAFALKQIVYTSKRSLEAQLGEFADAKLAVSKNPSWMGLMKMTMGVFISNPDLAKQTMLMAEDVEDTLVTWIEAAHADGRMEVTDTKLAANVFWSMVGGAFFWPSIFMGPMKSKETNAMKKELIQTFLARYQKT